MKRDLIFLYAGFIARYAGSFLSLPFLARVLEPQGLGTLVIATSVAAVLALCVEFGFGISALRDVSACKTDAERLTILDGVLCAKLGLFVVTAALFFGALLLAPQHLPAGRIALLVLLLGGLQGLSLSWYLQGTERASLAAGLEAATQLSWVIGALALVRTPQDVDLVLFCQVLAHAAALIVGLRLSRSIRVPISINRQQLLTQFRAGIPLFVMRAGVALFTTASVLIVGAVSGATEAGYYTAAERFAGTAIAAFNPASQAIMPYLVRRQAAQGDQAMLASARRVFVVLLILGSASMVAFLIAAPLIISLFTGSNYAPSVTVLRILCLAFPVVAISQALGLYVMIPMRMDNWFSAGILVGGAVSLIAAYYLTPTYGAYGMAVCRVLAEATLALFFALILAKRGLLGPVAGRRKGAA